MLEIIFIKSLEMLGVAVCSLGIIIIIGIIALAIQSLIKVMRGKK